MVGIVGVGIGIGVDISLSICVELKAVALANHARGCGGGAKDEENKGGYEHGANGLAGCHGGDQYAACRVDG